MDGLPDGASFPSAAELCARVKDLPGAPVLECTATTICDYACGAFELCERDVRKVLAADPRAAELVLAALASRAVQPARRASPAILGCYRSRAAAKQPVGSLTTAGRMPRRLSARSDPPRLRALIVQIVHLILARPSSL